MKILQDILVPQESVNDQSLTVVGLNFKTGDWVKKDDVLVELETSKAIVTLEAGTDGFVIYHCKLNDDVPLNALIIQIADTKPEDNIVAGELPLQSQIPELIFDNPSLEKYETQFSKKALIVLEKNNLSKTLFENYDFVNEDIILKYLNPGHTKTEVSELPRKETAVNPQKQIQAKSPELLSNVSFEKLPSAKRREIEYLSSVQNSGLVSTLYIDIDATGIIDSVSSQLSYFKNSILPLVIFETAKLLSKYPELNAFYDNAEIGKYLSINIGLAIDIDDGLKVVKLPNTSNLTILEIEEQIFQLSNKYLDKKLEVTDLTSITFTVTDLSATDLYFFKPLINKDNSAILGISKINNKTNSCVLSLSFDHRVTSGKYAGNFLTELKARVESFAMNNNGKRPTVKLACYKCLKDISEDSDDIGFIKVQTKSGEEKLICDTCLLMP